MPAGVVTFAMRSCFCRRWFLSACLAPHCNVWRRAMSSLWQTCRCTEGLEFRAHQGCPGLAGWQLFPILVSPKHIRAHHLDISGTGVEGVVRYHWDHGQQVHHRPHLHARWQPSGWRTGPLTPHDSKKFQARLTERMSQNCILLVCWLVWQASCSSRRQPSNDKAWPAIWQGGL